MLKILATLTFPVFSSLLLINAAMAQGVIKAPATPVPALEACPVASSGEAGTALTCRCDLTDLPGPVWGSGPYTNDSSICAAAVHAGIVETLHGPGDTVRYVGDVSLEMAAGCEEYRGTEANGVTTRDYGSWGLSFYFPDVQTATCGGGIGAAALCPNAIAAGVPDLTCTCTASDTTLGSVWGTGIYTDDSALCRAALHAGVITAEGGIINVVRTAGLKAYAASSQNGVDSLAYGVWQGSISFNQVGTTAGK